MSPTPDPPGVQIATATVLVRDYDEAVNFYRSALGLTVLSDTPTPDGGRFVLLGDPGAGGQLLLAQAVTAEEHQLVGRQTAGRVAFFLHTTDFAAQHRHMQQVGVVFHEQPRHEAYGTVAVFSDLYGNHWDLLEPR